MVNNSGIKPVGNQVLILVDDKALQKRAKASGLIVESKVTGEDTVDMIGQIVAVGDDCDVRQTAIGSWVMFDKFTGRIFCGADESVYRLIKPAAILAEVDAKARDKIKNYSNQ